MAPARSHQDAEQRSRTITNTQAQQDSTNPEIIPSTEQATNTKPISTNTIGGLSYAQITSQSTHTHNQYHSNSNNDTAEIKELLKQSIKNTEMPTRMISEQNAVLRQQTQQITVMLQLGGRKLEASEGYQKTQNNYRHKCHRKPSHRKAAMAARITIK